MTEFEHPQIYKTLVTENYNLVETIGSGTYASVYSAIRKDDRTEWVIKTQIDSIDIILPEINAFCSFQHPYMIKVVEIYLTYDVDTGNHICSYVMEEGVPLSNLVDAEDREPMSEKTKTEFLYKIILVLSFLQEHGVIYGDIKLENIIVKYDSTTPMLTDFGIYHFTDCGDTGVNQTWSDRDNHLFRKRGEGEIDALNNAMWATGIFVSQLMGGYKEFQDRIMLNHQNDSDVPNYIYELSQDPYEFFSGPQFRNLEDWLPLISFLLSDNRPRHFNELLEYEMFDELRNTNDMNLGLRWRTSDVPRSTVEFSRFQDSILSINAGAKFLEFSGDQRSLAYEYFHKYIGYIVFDYDVDIVDDEEVSQVGGMRIILFLISCLVLSASTLQSRRRSVGLNRLVEFTFSVDNTPVFVRQLKETVDFYLTKLIIWLDGSTLIRVPYYLDQFPGQTKEEKDDYLEYLISDISSYPDNLDELESSSNLENGCY